MSLWVFPLLSTYLIKAHQQNLNCNIQDSFTKIQRYTKILILYRPTIENKSADVQNAYQNGLLSYCTKFIVYNRNSIDIEFLC